jgi:hypothetical protein
MQKQMIPEFMIELEKVIEGPEILEQIYLSTEQAYKNKIDRGEKPRKFQIVDGGRDFTSKHADAWYLYYVKGYTMQAVAEALAHFRADGSLTDCTIANNYTGGGWRAIYQEEISGEAAEIAIRNMLFPTWKIISEWAKPDIINPEDEMWVDVKLRSRLKSKESIGELIANFEYEHVRKGKPMKIVKIGYVPQKARIEIWNVSLNPEYLENNVNGDK